jgi:hypothetical protein
MFAVIPEVMMRSALALACSVVLTALSLPLAAQVAVVRGPNGMMRAIGGPPEPDSFTLGNAGTVSVNVTLSQSGNFFTASPSSFTLDPRTTRTVTMTPTVTAGGFYSGSVTVSASGAQRTLTVPVRLFIGSQPQGSVAPQLGTTLLFAQGLPGQPHLSQLNVSNFGSARMTGMLTADVPWIEAPGGTVGIGSGETARIDFAINPALRPDSQSPLGALVGKMTMVWLRGTSNQPNAMQVQSTSATIIDITRASIVPQQAATLAAGEVATFLAGISDAFGISHVLVSNRATAPVNNNQLFYIGAGAAPSTSLLSALGQVPAATSAWFPFSPQRLFDVSNSIGSVQLRTPQPGQVDLAGFVEIIPDGQNVYVMAMPVLSSAASAPRGETLVFSGVERAGNTTTDMHVQETTGTAGAYTIEFFNAAGAPTGSTRTESIGAFGYATFQNVVPEGARSVRVTNTSAAAASISGYATVIDGFTRDRWTITDSRRAAPSAEVFLPLPAPNALEVWLTNTSQAPVAVTVSTEPGTARRRRSVAHGSPSAETQATVTLAPRESRLETFNTSPTGFVRISGPSGSFSASGRIRTAAPPRAGQFGTGVPALPPAASIGTAGTKQFTLADDQAGVAPPSLLLLETSGKAVTVRATIHFTFAAGSTLATSDSTAFRDYEVAAHRLLTVSDLVRSVLGPGRDSLGRLFKIVIDVQPIAGSGRVLAYLMKNEQSGDITLYAD